MSYLVRVGVGDRATARVSSAHAVPGAHLRVRVRVGVRVRVRCRARVAYPVRILSVRGSQPSSPNPSPNH